MLMILIFNGKILQEKNNTTFMISGVNFLNYTILQQQNINMKHDYSSACFQQYKITTVQ